MRNLIMLAASLFIIVWSTSCNKDKDENSSAQNGIAAKWTFEKVDYNNAIGGVPDRYTEQAAPGDYLDFRPNGELFARLFSDDEEGIWRMEGSDKIYISDTDVNDGTTYDIKTLTGNSLVLYAKDTDGDDYYEVTFYLKK